MEMRFYLIPSKPSYVFACALSELQAELEVETTPCCVRAVVAEVCSENEAGLWPKLQAALGQIGTRIERIGLEEALALVRSTTHVGQVGENGARAVIAVVLAPRELVKVRRDLQESEVVKPEDIRCLPRGVDLQREAFAWELWELYELTRTLRRECPWDRKQTPRDIIKYTLEEVYELADLIRQENPQHEKIKGELGDLLFQVYFLSYLAEEQGEYDLGEVASEISAKLVRRHPHVFGAASVSDAEDVRRNWDVIKRETEGREGIFHDLPNSFPALMFAQKVQERAAAVGFDWSDAEGAFEKLKEEITELEKVLKAAPKSNQSLIENELGDLLFSVVNVARKLRVSSELVLRDAAGRFKERVECAAKLAEKEGRTFADLELGQQESYYQAAKRLRP